mmetsp:Transcript_8245/g.21079  ORF Transcript_8245/g.21079 Transcript_8245/m.21079 type:complete len:237 (+) Transcript_8245:649-1359(+)
MSPWHGAGPTQVHHCRRRRGWTGRGRPGVPQRCTRAACHREYGHLLALAKRARRSGSLSTSTHAAPTGRQRAAARRPHIRFQAVWHARRTEAEALQESKRQVVARPAPRCARQAWPPACVQVQCATGCLRPVAGSKPGALEPGALPLSRRFQAIQAARLRAALVARAVPHVRGEGLLVSVNLQVTHRREINQDAWISQRSAQGRECPHVPCLYQTSYVHKSQRSDQHNFQDSQTPA